MQKRKKKTIGKNVGHKDADNKVLGDREAALKASCKMLGKSIGKLTKWHKTLFEASALENFKPLGNALWSLGRVNKKFQG